MPPIHPFTPLQYRVGPRADLSALIAPPYDVLDAAGKAALLQKSDRNIVAVDLPHLPAKELGPPSAYARSAKLLNAWQKDGTLTRPSTPRMFVYRQTFSFGGKSHQRTGMACTVDIRPFGPDKRGSGGILPHEQTFSGPKEDRMALMKATAAQLSPIFGLHQDESAKAAKLLTRLAGASEPDVVATTDDGTLHELWTITDPKSIAAYQAALAGEDIFIADGHHRYTTGLNYLNGLLEKGDLPADHPARRSMFVLISMSDRGLVIGPTHRVLGGMAGYSFPRFAAAARHHFFITPVEGGMAGLEPAMHDGAKLAGKNVLGLFDFATGAAHLATPILPDPLAELKPFARKPVEWRTLDVALVQHLVVESICQPALNGGGPVKWAFPHSIDEVADIGAGHERGSGGGKGFTPQLAVIVRPTPLDAVRAVSRAGELMPQKSTFFYPKLATGLFIHPLA